MTFHRSALLATASLALVLPSLSVAQEAMTEDAGPALEDGSEAMMTEDSGVAMTEESEAGMGVTEVETTSASEPMDLSTWTYDDLYANGISIEQIMSAEVYGPGGDDVGDVDDVLFNMDGEVLSIVARMDDGFLGLGRTHVNIPWEMVSTEAWADGLVIPFTEDEVDTFAMSAEEAGAEIVATEDVAEVSGGAFEDVETGPNVWQATDLLNDAARLQEGEGYETYGMVNDIVLRDGRIAAVLVTPDASWGAPAGSVYGYPYAGTAGWTPGTTAADGTTVETDETLAAQGTTGMTTGTYDLPYDRTQAEMVRPFDPAMLMD